MAGSWKPVADIRGRDGTGVPEGGRKGSVLRKVGDTDFATSWGRVTYEDIDGKVPPEALPEIGGQVFVPKSEAEMLNLAAAVGATAIRSDVGKTFVLAQLPASTLANWVEMKTSQAVTSVAGKQGNVTLSKADVGLDKVDNTADADKPVATSTVPGLMSAADKALLDTAPRDGNRGGLLRKGMIPVAPGGIPTSNKSVDLGFAEGDMVPTYYASTTTFTDRSIVNFQFLKSVTNTGQIDGKGAIAVDTNWNNLKTSITGVVNGYPTGCPIMCGDNTGGGIAFKRPAWKLDVQELGSGYVTQRAMLLHCIQPAYANGAGLTFERIYDAAASKWGSWNAIAGDTGWIVSAISGAAGFGDTTPIAISDTATMKRYGATYPQIMWRNGHITITGTMTTTSTSLTGTDNTKGPGLWWFPTDAKYGTGLWMDFNAQRDVEQGGVQQGSSTATWYLGRNSDGISWGAYRYSGTPGTNPWLRFQWSYPAPLVKTNTAAWVAGD